MKEILLKKVYSLYKVEPIKIPQEIPSTGEVIGYDEVYPEWNELKCYKVIKALVDSDIRLNIDIDEDYSVLVESEFFGFFFTETAKSLEECILACLYTLYDEVSDAVIQSIREVLKRA